MSGKETAKVTVYIKMKQRMVINEREDLVEQTLDFLETVGGEQISDEMKEKYGVPDDFRLDDDTMRDFMDDIYKADTETIETTTEGSIFKKGSQIELVYDEPESLGLGNSVTTVIFDLSSPRLVTVIRRGDSKLSLTVEQGVLHSCVMSAMGMDFSISVIGKRVLNSLSPKGGTLDMTYTIESGAMKYSQYNRFSLEAKPRDEGAFYENFNRS